MANSISQAQLIYQYYLERPNQVVPHAEVVEWATAQWLALTGKPLADPDRAVRKLAQNGALVKVGKGMYKYDPDHIERRDLEDFTEAQKKEIKERDGYKCVICGKGPKEGVELHVDHTKPKDLGGEATIDNGETLCAQHNFLKKNYSITETGKRVFIKLNAQAKKADDNTMIAFTNEILALYDKYSIDTQITK